MIDRLRVRAWDKSFCRMIYNIFFFWKENTITVYELHKDASKSYLPNSHIVLEQCTGLKDKNGRLIYENDIVKITGDILTIDPRYDNKLYIVTYNDLSFGFDMIGEEKGTLYGECWEYEFVGNVHENPELLEDK